MKDSWPILTGTSNAPHEPGAGIRQRSSALPQQPRTAYTHHEAHMHTLSPEQPTSAPAKGVGFGGAGPARLRKSTVVALVLAFTAAYAAATHAEDSRDPSRFTYARLYCGPEGDTHFQDVTAELGKTNFAPPAPPIYIGSDFPPRAHSSADLMRVGALVTWKTVSTILPRRSSSESCCRASFPSPRPMGRRGASLPAAYFGWRTRHLARDTSPSWGIRPDSSCSFAESSWPPFELNY
jgi:hypothetical protein